MMSKLTEAVCKWCEGRGWVWISPSLWSQPVLGITEPASAVEECQCVMPDSISADEDTVEVLQRAWKLIEGGWQPQRCKSNEAFSWSHASDAIIEVHRQLNQLDSAVTSVSAFMLAAGLLEPEPGESLRGQIDTAFRLAINLATFEKLKGGE